MNLQTLLLLTVPPVLLVFWMVDAMIGLKQEQRRIRDASKHDGFK